MNCDDVRNGVYVYLDGEFAAPEAKAYERHVEACNGCRQIVEGEGLFLAQFKSKLDHGSAPAELTVKVEEALAARPAPRLQKSAPVDGGMTSGVWMRAGVWAAAASLVFGVVWWIGYLDQAARPDLQQAIAVHQRDLPMEVQGTREDVRSYLQRNVAFSVDVPYKGVKNLRLTGARLVNVGAKPAVLYSYDMDGRRLSVVQMGSPRGIAQADSAPVIKNVEGYRVITYRRGGTTNQVIGNVRKHDMKRLMVRRVGSSQ